MLVVVLLTGCGVPVQVSRESPRDVVRELTSNVLTTGKLSLATENVLHRWNLTERFESDPEGTIATLHAAVVEGRVSADEVFSLSELSFKYADRAGKRPYYLATSVYAYAFLFPESRDQRPFRFDPRVRIASDLYNRGITEGFASKDGKTVDLREGTYPLPFGELAMRFDPQNLVWGERTLYNFVPVADLKVRGLGARHRRSGIGAPLAARTWVGANPSPADKYIARKATVPVTALLRIPDARHQLRGSTIQSTMDLFSGWDTRTVIIDGREAPLEVDPSAALAWGLAESPIWSWEIQGFLTADLAADWKTQLAFIEPYRPGKIPVVFVHGTASSPGRWADILNDLQADPRIRNRYQFWFFFYTTGNPIPYSAAKLRNTLTEAVHLLDPAGKDPALHDMVIVGHSQGGLLTKMTVIDPGDRFWKVISDEPFEKFRVNASTREVLHDAMFPKPLPFVKRVVFVATPHQGSYVAAFSLSRFVQRFVRLPVNVLSATTDLVTGNSGMLKLRAGSVGGAVYGMVPGSPLVKTLAAEPIVPGVVAHSIIPVRGGVPGPDAADGVVRYESAHIEGVASEKVVNSSHSCQSNPDTIEELRRILLEHAAAACAAGFDCPAPTQPIQARQ